MKSWRENPESEESQRATKQHEREVFALKMMAHQQTTNQASTLLKATFKALGVKEEKPRFVCLCCGERKHLKPMTHVCVECFEELEAER